jgi:hypothetical protein
MNKNFAFLTSIPQIPEIPYLDFENRDDVFCWVIYQMKGVNLLLQAYVSNDLHVEKKPFSNYFQTIKDLLINEMKKGKGYDSVSESTVASLRETFSHMNELVPKVSLAMKFRR